MSYVVTPKGMPYYYWAGPYVGFTSIKTSALQYVSLEVAKMAAEIVQEDRRRDFPDSRDLIAVKFE